MKTDAEAEDAFLACSNEVRDIVKAVMLKHDGRLLFACITAEAAYIGAMLRETKIYAVPTLVRLWSEGLITVLDHEVKTKVIHVDENGPLGTKQ